MSSEWTATCLGDCVTFVSGNTPSKSKPELWNGSIPWISAKDMKSFWVEDAADHLSDAGVRVASKLVPVGTTLLLVRGMTLHNDIPIVRTRNPATFNQDVKAIFPKSTLISDYVPYMLLGNKHKIQGLVNSAGHGTGCLGSEQLKKLPVLVPPKEEQEDLAQFFGSLDARITLLRETSTSLESMAQALFKSWFVDFDPVRAKMEGLRPESMDESTAALFPDGFGESELGVMPKGWKVKRLSEVLKPRNERVEDMEVPEYASTNNGLIARSKIYKKQLAVSSAKNKVIRKGDLVFGLSRQILNFGQMEDDIGSVSSAYKVYQIDGQEIIPHLLGRLIRTRIEYFFNAVSASSREGQSVSSEALAMLAFVCPPAEIQQKLWRTMSPLLERGQFCIGQAEVLSELRNTLLPRLISGQLRLPKAEAQVQAIAA